MNIIKNLVPADKYSIKCPFEMTPTRIVVHNTANDAPAKNEINYMKNNNNQVSFHYAVDDTEIVQGIEENRNAWHSGDGNGKGNREGIAIEICYSLSGGDRFVQAEKNAVTLIVDILKRYNWGIDKVTKHQDYSGKYCPHRTLDSGWDRFINIIKTELNSGSEEELDMEEINKRFAKLENEIAELKRMIGAGTVAKKSVDEIAREILYSANYGGWGTGAERTRKLTEAGYNAKEVQDRINQLA